MRRLWSAFVHWIARFGRRGPPPDLPPRAQITSGYYRRTGD